MTTWIRALRDGAKSASRLGRKCRAIICEQPEHREFWLSEARRHEARAARYRADIQADLEFYREQSNAA